MDVSVLFSTILTIVIGYGYASPCIYMSDNENENVDFQIHMVGGNCSSNSNDITCIPIIKDNAGNEKKVYIYRNNSIIVTCSIPAATTDITVKRYNLSRSLELMICRLGEQPVLVNNSFSGSILRVENRSAHITVGDLPDIRRSIFCILCVPAIFKNLFCIYKTSTTSIDTSLTIYTRYFVKSKLSEISNNHGIQPASAFNGDANKESSQCRSCYDEYVSKEQEKEQKGEKNRSVSRDRRKHRELSTAEYATIQRGITTDISITRTTDPYTGTNIQYAGQRIQRLYKHRRSIYKSSATDKISHDNVSDDRSRVRRMDGTADTSDVEIHQSTPHDPEYSVRSSNAPISTNVVQKSIRDNTVSRHSNFKQHFTTANGIQHQPTYTITSKHTYRRTKSFVMGTSREPETTTTEPPHRYSGPNPRNRRRKSYIRGYSQGTGENTKAKTTATTQTISTDSGSSERKRRDSNSQDYSTSTATSRPLYENGSKDGGTITSFNTMPQNSIGITKVSNVSDISTDEEGKVSFATATSTNNASISTLRVIEIFGKGTQKQNTKVINYSTTSVYETTDSDKSFHTWSVTHPLLILLMSLGFSIISVWVLSTLIILILRWIHNVY